MRRVNRVPLADEIQRQLHQKQIEADRKREEGILQVDAEWKSARQTKLLIAVLTTLKSMMGERERCMYCLDSHGTDIEHFWPKTPYPERIFLWPNLLLCCTECGRLKGDDLPLSEGQPLLIDPTTEEPWLYLDFDPTTGNIVARFELDRNDWSPKGLKTVEIFHLDRREALAVGYQRTYRRLSDIVERFLTEGTPTADDFFAALSAADDHGLLGWCFMGTGKSIWPFSDLREQQPDFWNMCQAGINCKSS
jgi:uncharacterized protein (TIGR02646 family)